MKNIYIVFLFIMNSIYTSGQEVNNHWGTAFELNTEVPDPSTLENQENYYASDSIKLSDGFESHPADEGHFVARSYPLMVFPPAIDTTIGPPGNNNGGIVGTIPGSFSVSPTGAASYYVPLSFPGGTNNMTPGLSLNYSSQGGEGILGESWQLGGISVINRFPYSYYYNDTAQTVTFSSDDQLLLDGQHLIKISENEYRTENESFKKIVPIDGHIKNGFVVYHKDGRIYKYGTCNNSRLNLQYSPQTIAWYVDTIFDPSNNYISFEYYNYPNYGFICPNQIKYTGNNSAGLNPYYKIVFSYENNFNTPKRYFYNESPTYSSLFSQVIKRLVNISCFYMPEGNYIYEYELNYEQNGLFDKHYLSSITHFDSDGNYYNPTKFQWDFNGHEPAKYFQGTLYDDINGSTSFFSSDFNQDGKDDLIVFRKLPDNKEFLSIHRNNGNGGFHYSMQFTHTFDEDVESFQTGDFNGDGINEFLFTYIDEGSTVGKIMFIDYDGISNTFSYSVTGELFSLSFDDFENPRFLISDFTGDQIMDCCVLFSPAPDTTGFVNLVVYTSTESDPLSELVSNFTGTWEHNPKCFFANDFDGDNKAELLLISDEGSIIFELSNNNLQIYKRNTTLDLPDLNGEILSGDFNKDGKADILYLNNQSEENVKLFHSHGRGFIAAPSQTIENIILGNNRIHALDLNGDKFCDLSVIIILESHISHKYARIDYLTNPDGKSFSQADTLIMHHCLGNPASPTLNNLRYLWCDVYNSGTIDLITSDLIDIDHTYFTYCDAENRHYTPVSKITDGFGLETSIEYAQIDMYSDYMKGVVEGFPVLQLVRALPVVTEYNIESGIGTGMHSFKPKYKGAKYHRCGKGFLGFDEFTMINNTKGTITTTYNSHNNPFYHIQTDSIKQWTKNSNILIGRISFSNFYSDFGDKRYLHYVNETSEEKFDLNGDLMDFTYEDLKYYLNSDTIPIRLETNMKKEIGSEWFNKLQEISLLNHTTGSSWIIGLQDTIKTTYTSYNEDSITNLIVNEYNSLKPWHIQSTKNTPNNQPLFSTGVSYDTYDDFGNLLQKTMQPLSPKFLDEPNLVTQYEYKITSNYHCRFLSKITKIRDGITYEENFEFNNKLGLKTKDIDINNLETQYYYDNFGRLTKTIYPDNTKDVTVHRWSIDHPDNPANGVYYSWSEASGSVPVLAFFDKRGRELKTITKGFNGQKICTKNTYYYVGLLEKAYEPYFVSEGEGNFSNYIYDELNRVEEEQLPSHTIKYTYEGLTIKTKNMSTNVEITNTLNPIGKADCITDPSGTISYEYYSSGNIKSIVAAGGTTIYEYDEAGNQKKLTEPNTGITTFDYDSYSRLRTQTDFNGDTTNIQYDELGRVINKEIVAGTGNPDDDVNIFYSYITDDNTYGFGSIESIIGQNNISYHCFYDDFGRINRLTETIEGQTYSNYVEYDKFGRVKKYTYPSGYQITNYFNENGYFGKIKESGNNIILAEILDMNQRGQITNYLLGNGLRTTRGYDDFGFTSSIITGDGNIQDLSYNFEPSTGNLNWREDNTNGLTLHEEFTYDSILHNRLIGWGEDNQDKFNVLYANNGNILGKTDITVNSPNCYQYNSEKPHAITNLVNISSDYLAVVDGEDQEIEYTAFHKIKSIIQDDKKLEFAYGPDETRKIMKYYEYESENWVLKKTKYYMIGNYEIEVNNQTYESRELLFVGGFLVKELISTGENNTYYLYADYLGNLQTVTDETGTILKRYSFDPWGRRRHPDTWENYTYTEVLTEDFLFDRGYTGHEHLDLFGLINMNGRVYDPWLGRFLSPDPVIQQPFSTQNFNRYSYVLNNPLKYTDPSGFSYKPDDWSNTGTGALYINSVSWSSYIGSTPTGYSNFTSGPTGYYYRGGNYYSYETRQQVSYQEVYQNYIVPNSTSYTGQGLENLYSDLLEGFTIYEVEAFGNITLASAFGDLGDVSIGENGGLTFHGQDAAAYSGGLIVKAAKVWRLPEWASDIKTGTGALSVGNGIKTGLMDYTVRTNYKSARTASQFNKLRPTQQVWRTTNTLGKSVASYLKYAKGLGYIGAGLSTTYSIVKAGSYYFNGGTDWQVGAKATLDVIMIGVGFIGPIGFGISASYFLLDAATGGLGGFGEIEP